MGVRLSAQGLGCLVLALKVVTLRREGEDRLWNRWCEVNNPRYSVCVKLLVDLT
jgi:hypothetical protein